MRISPPRWEPPAARRRNASSAKSAGGQSGARSSARGVVDGRGPMRAMALLGAIVLSGCTGGVNPRGGDGGRDDGVDASIARDGGRAVEHDAGPLPPDAGTDSGPPACTPTRTECMGELECGAVPNGCPGGALACGD